MTDEPIPVATPKPASWLRRHILVLLIGLAVLSGSGFLRSCYYAGQVKEILDTHPKPKSKAQVKALQQQVKDLTQEKEKNQQAADIALARTVAPEKDAALRKKIIDSLITAYHALPSDTSLATPAGVTHYLEHYVPSADDDL
jgi:membrane-bound ClpP family serine protease